MKFINSYNGYILREQNEQVDESEDLKKLFDTLKSLNNKGNIKIQTKDGSFVLSIEEIFYTEIISLDNAKDLKKVNPKNIKDKENVMVVFKLKYLAKLGKSKEEPKSRVLPTEPLSEEYKNYNPVLIISQPPGGGSYSGLESYRSLFFYNSFPGEKIKLENDDDLRKSLNPLNLSYIDFSQFVFEQA